MKRSSCDQLEIDTKDICLLCLGSDVEINCFDPMSLPSLQGVKHLLRYLNVSSKDLFNCSSEFLQSMEIKEDIDLKISLCSGCSSVAHKFYKLYQEYELIQIKFGNCVQSLYQSISEGNESQERVRNYKDQMRPTKSFDLINSSIAANLRNETFKKCFVKLQSMTPRVIVAAPKPKDENHLKLSKPADVAIGNSSTNMDIQVPEQKTTLKYKQDAQTLEDKIKDLIEISDDILIDDTQNAGRTLKVAEIESGFTNDSNTLHQISTEPIADVVAEVKSAKPIKRRRRNYFDSIRKKLKTKFITNPPPKPTAPVTKPSVFTSSSYKGQGKRIRTCVCEYCEDKFTTTTALRDHMYVSHCELFINKYLPSNISMNHCKLRIQAVLKEIYQISDTQCQCVARLSSNHKLKRHLIGYHPEQVAMKVFENIQLFPQEPDVEEEDFLVLTDTESGKVLFACKYCDVKYPSRKSFLHHMANKHPEHIIYKHFPHTITLDDCRQRLTNVFEEVFKNGSKSGYKCKFCIKTIVSKPSFKDHAVFTHGKLIALEAQQFNSVSLLRQHLEGESSVLSNSKNDIYSNESSTPQTTDIEIGESFIKFENPPQEILGLDLDPLDVNYLE